MAGQPRNIRIDDDIYSALIQCVAARNAKAKAEGSNELTDITKLINECLRLQMPIHIWDRLDKRVTNLEHEIKTIKENI
tara:strand:- start:1742 stop:1978 length:237 start_codon:yes stop_codon:yes gene_type:complete